MSEQSKESRNDGKPMLPAVKIKLLVLGFIASAVASFIAAQMLIIAKKVAEKK